MNELREHVPLPLDVDLSERACPALVTRITSQLAPGLERSVGAVRWTREETSGVDWTAEGVVEGALVVVCLRPSSREVSLLVDPTFTPPSGHMSTTLRPFVGILAVSAAVGAIRRSALWGVLTFIGMVTVWIVTDIVRQERRIRRASATFDRAAWSRRFQDAVSNALKSR